MRIAYNLADQHFERTQSIGIFNVSVQLLQHLARDGRYDLHVLGNSSLHPFLEDVMDYITFHTYDQPLSGKLQRITWDQFGVYRESMRLKANFLFLPKGFSSFLRKPPLPTGALVHDVIHTYLNQAYPERKRQLGIKYFDYAIQATLRHSDLVFTNSQFTLDEVADYASQRNIPDPPLRYLGIGFEPIAPGSWPVEKNGGIVVFGQPNMPNTNQRLLDYLDRWQQASRSTLPVHWLAQKATHRPEHENWTYHQRLPENAYRKIINEAQVIVFASEYEGFGMIPVEAVLAGTPAVYSDIPVLREVMGDTGHPFALDDYAAFSAALDTSLTLPRNTIESWASSLNAMHNWPDLLRRFHEGLESITT